MGTDQFFYLHTWYRPERFAGDGRLRGHGPAGLAPAGTFWITCAPSWTRPLRPANKGWFRLPGGHGVRPMATTLLDISSTDIKRRVAARALHYLPCTLGGGGLY